MTEKHQHSGDAAPPPAAARQERHALGAAAAAADEGDQPDPIHHHNRRRIVYDEHPIEEAPPPAYDSDRYGKIDISQNGMDTGARVGKDGRVNIKIKDKSNRVRDILAPMLFKSYTHPTITPEPEIPEGLGDVEGRPPPPMNIVIQIVGSRGDVQPFIALGQVLKRKFKHRVRIATHPTFRQFVTENDLEFFSIGGDPAELMAFMVKNPGLMPGIESVKAGDIGKRRKTIYEMINGCWRSCIEAGDGTGISASDELLETQSIDSAVSLSGDPEASKPFVADAIIANPVSFAHIHVAEKLGIPLHLMFTMPWSPTQAFPHPLANIISSNTDQSLANYISYILVDMLTWQGLGDLINKFRERVLHLEPVSIIWAPGMLARLKIPYTYCWSPALIPKPKDWSSKIDISGFYFLNLATNYTPPADLASFLDAGPPPVYIGFGSIVVDDPNAMTTMIFEAVKKTGQRALVSKGWGGLGADELGIPEGVFMLGNCPHDWLFKRVSCVVHHGGAGTTAAGIAAGRPTVIIPFFGDQPFWGAMTARAGAGPKPVPYKELTADKLAELIQDALKPSSLERAAELSDKIKQETGAETGADSFHKQLAPHNIRCSLSPDRVAVWRVRKTDIRLSALAATVLGNEGLLSFEDLKLYRVCEYDVDEGPPEPISGGAAALIGTLSEIGAGVVDMPAEVLKSMKFGEYKQKGDDSPTKDGESIAPKTPPTLAAPANGSLNHSRSPSVSSRLTTGTAETRSGNTAHADMLEAQLSKEVNQAQASTTAGDSAYLSTPTSPLRPSAMATVLTPSGSARPVAADSPRNGSRTASPNGAASRERSRSRSGSRSAHQDLGQIGLESIMGTARAGGKIAKAGFKSPVDFTMALAQGFHNAPKLYGDTTVRKQDRVTDFSSGLRAAGKEFGYGFYDGITGLVTQPIRGARKEGPAGFVKGAVRGAFGLVLKPSASIWGLPGYTFKGIYMEIAKHFGSSTQNYIIAARTAQGYEEWKLSSRTERENIVAAWKSSKFEKKRGKQKYGKDRVTEIESHILTPTQSRNNVELVHGFRQTSKLSFDERKELDKRRQALKKEEKERKKLEKKKSHSGYRHIHGDARSIGSTRSNPNSADLLSANEDDFEAAIQRSISQTSRGNPQEDQVLERALRASVNALRNNPEPITDANEHEVFERAIQASVTEAERARQELQDHTDEGVDLSAGQERAALQRALTASLDEHISLVGNDLGTDTEDDEDYRRAIEASQRESQNQSHLVYSESAPHDNYQESGTTSAANRVQRDDGDGDDDDDDEELKLALAASRNQEHEDHELKKAIEASMVSHKDEQAPPSYHEDDELRKALTLSSEESKQRTAELEKQRTEEEIVMEYVKKQSLLEEEHRKAMQNRSKIEP